MSATTSTTIITSMMGDIGTTLAQGLPIILGLIGVLIGLFFLIRFLMRKIGGAKG